MLKDYIEVAATVIYDGQEDEDGDIVEIVY